MKITGEFKVELKPLELSTQGKDGVNLGRMSIDKNFYGELEANSKGEMLSAMTTVAGSAGYVAIEQVSGTLAGKQGSFVLQHFGVMANGNDRLILEVIPDSATGNLSGLTGTMSITMKDGKHYYEFDYQLNIKGSE